MPLEPADLSVIVPAYRAAETLPRALLSVAAQTVLPREVIVVDDGSGDGTFQVARAMADRLKGISLNVLWQGRRGAAAARNRALEVARGDLVAFLDADDAWLPEKLARSIAVLEQTGATIVAHDGWIVEDGRQTLNACARRFAEGPDPLVTLYRKGIIDTCSVVARREAVLAAGGFDETLPNAHDFELWLAMLSQPGATFRVFDEPLVHYHVQPGGIMSHTDRRLRCGIVIARRHASSMVGRPGGRLGNLAYRLTAIHREAFAAQLGRGRMVSAIGVVWSFPFRLLAALTMTGQQSRPRPAYVAPEAATR